jgi:membrane-bound serine protease (ClpP class)
MPDAGVLATILLIVGLFLLALELMIPSFGMIGILAAVCLVVSAWSAWSAWWMESPGLFWTYASFWVLGIPSVMGGMLFLLQNTALGDHIVLRGPGEDQKVSKQNARSGLEALIGQLGTATSMLCPGGMVNINDERFHAESSGVVLDAKSTVEVIAVRGNRLVVKAASEATIAAATAAAADQESKHEPTRAQAEAAESMVAQAGSDVGETAILDFEIPED